MPLGTLEARGEEKRYLGCSHDPNFHHLYRARDRRIFTTDDVTFVESDIQLPDYSGNLEIELEGVQDISDEDKQVVDSYADRDDEVDWEHAHWPILRLRSSHHQVLSLTSLQFSNLV